MLARIVDFHLRHRWLVSIGLAGLVLYGVYVIARIPVDAFPDLTNNQVVVTTECPAMAPSEVEMLVTYPIETGLMGLPKMESVRSISKLGLSMVTVVFDDSVDTYFARQIVNERLQEVRSRIPQGLDPRLGPVATAFGEIYQYTIEGQGQSAMDLKTLHDWQIKNQLRTVPGVNEVNTWGGETRQYQVEIDPVSLQRYGLTLRNVYERLSENNANFGGGFIEHASEQYTIRGLGRARGVGDLEQIVLLSRAGTPVLLRDAARVTVGPMPRHGAVTRDGKGETVSGMIIMLKGENSKNVIARVKTKIAELRLPQGVKLIPFYDQSTVIDSTIATVRTNLLEGGALVIAVLLVFLGNIRAACIVAAVIPLSMLAGFIGMHVFGVSANLMSLGAIDFGMIVDGAVVMMENSVRRLQMPGRQGLDAAGRVREAAHEVSRPIVFGVAIIIAVYLPILFLEGLEGRMFRPMAITVCAALAGSLVLAIAVVPTAAALLLRGGVRAHRERWFDALRSLYIRVLGALMRRRAATVAGAVLVMAGGGYLLTVLGTEFMPRLDEGSILIESRKLPGIALTDSVEMNARVEKLILSVPEVTGVVTKLGRPDLATEAMGIYQGDIYVLLKPRGEWKSFETKQQLIDALDAKLAEIPGVAFSFTQPMAMRLDETVSGVKADVAMKIFGEDSRVLEQLASRGVQILRSVRGAADVQMEIVSGVAELRVEIDRAALARYGLNVSDVRDLMEVAIGGRHISEMLEGQRRFDIVLRLPDRYRTGIGSIRDLLLTAPGGERVPLSQVARIELARGPEIVSRENAQRRIVAQANVRGRDLGGFAAEAQEKVRQQLALPAGYFIDWGGQFENQERATRRLLIVIPLTIAIIFGILYATFGSVPQALLILLNIPFALVGGVAALWLRGLNLNLSASIGLIALFGVAVLNGIVLVSAINRIRREGSPILEAVMEGAAIRLRPVLMTALVASLGFVPTALATSAGAEVQRPLATVVIGGLVTSTLLTLFLLPVVYPWFSRRVAPGAERENSATEAGAGSAR